MASSIKMKQILLVQKIYCRSVILKTTMRRNFYIFFLFTIFFSCEQSYATGNSELAECIESADYVCVAKFKKDFKTNLVINYKGTSSFPIDVLNLAAFLNTLEKKYDDSNFVKIAETLLNNGAVFSKKNLYLVVAGGCTELIDFYLKKGLPIDIRLEGKSLIEIATENDRKPLIDLLVKHGALPVKKQQEYTLQLIRLLGSFSTIDRFKVDDLIKKGASINEKDSNGVTPMGALVRNPSVVTNGSDLIYLLEKGADPSVQTNPMFRNLPKKTYPLNLFIMWSGRKDQPKKVSPEQQAIIDNEFQRVLEAMLNNGFRVAAKDEDLKTPMHYAATYDFPQGIKLLLKHGAKKTDKDKDGKTPYDLAESSEAISLLK